jgi:hypothetical protein
VSVRLLYGRWCDYEGCEAWTGGLKYYPDPAEAEEIKIIRRMGWTHDGDRDLCPEHVSGGAS